MTKLEQQKEWENRSNLYRASGQSVTRWCAANNVRPGQLWYWLRWQQGQEADWTQWQAEQAAARQREAVAAGQWERAYRQDERTATENRRRWEAEQQRLRQQAQQQAQRAQQQGMNQATIDAIMQIPSYVSMEAAMLGLNQHRNYLAGQGVDIGLLEREIRRHFGR